MEYPLTRSVEVMRVRTKGPPYQLIQTGEKRPFAEFWELSVAEYVADLMNRAFYGAHVGTQGGLRHEKPNA